MTSTPLRKTPRRDLRRRPKYSVRPFLATIVIIAALCLLSAAHGSIQHHVNAGNGAPIRRRSASLLSRAENEECSLVHRATDKCAFVKQNCEDEEAGIFSYLTLYYCRLPHAKPVAFTILVLWLCLLFSTIGIAASDFFCVNLSTISTLLGMSESMAGVTFLAFGNGSPDVFSTFAAMSTNSGSLAVGELMGAAGFITAVVAGSMAIVHPFKVARKSFIRDVGFFIVAASFSMVFLWDGRLYLWECIVMVCFYVFYVMTVVVWHWWLGKRRKRRQRAATIRSQYITPGGEEEEIPQEYHDDDDGQTMGSRTPQRGISIDDFAALEAAGQQGAYDDDADEDDEVRERWLGEVSSNMRLSRPPLGERRNTHNPIRPSLVGALEFRAVLSSLKKSRNIQTIPLNLRRYSDDPNFTTAQQQDLLSTASDPAARPPYHVGSTHSTDSPHVTKHHLDVRHVGNRARAVSANDIDNVRFDRGILQQGTKSTVDLLGPLAEDTPRASDQSVTQPPPSPSISLSPPASEHGLRGTSPTPPRGRTSSPDLLAPPGLSIPNAPSVPSEQPKVPASRPSPKLNIPPSPPTAFPAFTDHPSSATGPSSVPSIRLPSPSASPDSMYRRNSFVEPEMDEKPLRWWPYKVLPSPQVLISTLFPTLYSWHDKNIWEKFLGVIAAPSVFLLTITLPVVETQKDESMEDDDMPAGNSLPGPLTPLHGNQQSITFSISEPDESGATESTSLLNGNQSKPASRGSPAPPPILTPTQERMMDSPEQLPADYNRKSELKEWNRWLVILQAFTAPFFIVLIIWANTNADSPRALLKPTLIALLCSLCLLAVLLTTTTPTRPPRWRVLLCFLGFAVSVAWISSIANEVVGVLKTIGVVLNMSDAILGLTIFAVGNSIGDLVADITVAKLGFSVMAFSAALGGPMLNILLGIGLSGGYLTIKKGKHRQHKHPDKPIRFKPYHIEVSTTLVISGATLLLTLLTLLVAVPARRWRMDRVIGWTLVAIWVTSTAINVVLEVLGVGGSVG